MTDASFLRCVLRVDRNSVDTESHDYDADNDDDDADNDDDKDDVCYQPGACSQ